MSSMVSRNSHNEQVICRPVVNGQLVCDRRFVDDLLLSEPLWLHPRKLIRDLPFYIDFWQKEIRSWKGKMPPATLTPKILLMSQRWSSLVPDLTKNDLYLFLTGRAPCPQLLHFVWNLPMDAETSSSFGPKSFLLVSRMGNDPVFFLIDF